MTKVFLLCWGQMLLYTLGVIVACGLTVEICYRLCFLVMGERIGRPVWRVTSWLGTPVHELGHALMCLAFAHRIERMRLFSTRHESAVVEHSYNKRNPYAVFGNFWIGLGPIFMGLALFLLLLWLAFPAGLAEFHTATEQLLSAAAQGGDVVGSVLGCMRELIVGVWNDATRPMWVRIIALAVMFSLALHVRLSASDMWSMRWGLVYFLLLSAVVSLILTLLGEQALSQTFGYLRQLAWLTVSLFGLILLFGTIQLALALTCRLTVMIWRACVRSK